MHGLGSLHYAELMLQKIGVLGVRKVAFKNLRVRSECCLYAT